MARAAVAGGTSRSVGMASVNGAWAITAATVGPSAATAGTWPPLYEVPHSHARGVDAVALAGPRQHRAVVVVLAANVEQLAWFAGRGTEVAIVEQHDGVAGVAERLGVAGQPIVASGGEAVRHDDARCGPGAVRPVEVGGDLLAAGRNTDVARC
ncbi:hypothetical protein MDOR_15040 [Mycolicibacterium doricum]|uniref:Uncharacterized protein n=1 Tax=Mycolicibacterium doricum TaxID=126673 RepID=A0A7I7VSG9_9MYCO|nr:hypothetical protein MDOR_15040 [Mycolicibacterium doricum]